MDARELRVGNIIQCNSKIEEIHCPHPEQPFLNTTEYGVGVLSWKDLEPIELDEYWLLKLGFEKVYESDFREKWEYPKDYRFGYSKNVQAKNIPEGATFKCSTYEHIKYVHQLQNLYFILSTQELTAKISADEESNN